MNDIWCNTLSETLPSSSTDETLFEPRTETAAALSLNRGARDSWLMERWRAAESAPAESTWAYLPADICDELESGAHILTSDDIYWLVDVALGTDPVRSVAALRVLGGAAGIDEICSRRFTPIFAEALRSGLGRVRAEAAELVWACRMVQCTVALQRAAEREQHGHVKRTMTHALDLLRGKSGDSQR